jgi:hypothetical protein
MGGVAGHMDHLYDNRDLTFGEMKDIIRAAANAELSTEEKVDGQNLFISYSVPEGKAKGASWISKEVCRSWWFGEGFCQRF